MMILREFIKLFIHKEQDKTTALEHDLKENQKLRHEARNRIRAMEIEYELEKRRQH